MVELFTQTSKEIVLDDAVKDRKELFSILPQKAEVKLDQESTPYLEEVFPQYPLISQIGVALEHASPAKGLAPQGGAGTGSFTQMLNEPDQEEYIQKRR